jgi:glycerol-3-phosphate dehydrogenase
LLRSAKNQPSRRSREHVVARHGANFFSVAGGKYTTYRLIAEQTIDGVYDALGRRREPCRTGNTPLPSHRPVPAGEKIAAVPEVFASDIAHACDYEMAMTVSDVMRRRTRLALSRHGGVETATRVAALMAKHLGWSDAQMYESQQDYLGEWEQNRP